MRLVGKLSPMTKKSVAKLPVPHWPTLIQELNAADVSKSDISRQCDCGTSTVGDLSSGKVPDPRYSIGLNIVNLHRKLVK